MRDQLTGLLHTALAAGRGGGVQVFEWDVVAGKVYVKTVPYEGDQYETVPLSASPSTHAITHDVPPPGDDLNAARIE